MTTPDKSPGLLETLIEFRGWYLSSIPTEAMADAACESWIIKKVDAAIDRAKAELAEVRDAWPSMGVGPRPGEPDRDSAAWLSWFCQRVYAYAQMVPAGDAKIALELSHRLASQPASEPKSEHVLGHDEACVDWCDACRAERLAREKKPDPEPDDEIEEVVQAIERWTPLTDSLGTAVNNLVNELHDAHARAAEAEQRVRELEASGNTPGDMQIANDRVKVLEDEVEELRQRADERPALRELKGKVERMRNANVAEYGESDGTTEDASQVIAWIDELIAKQEDRNGKTAN